MAELMYLKNKLSDPIVSITVAGNVLAKHAANIVNDVVDVPKAFVEDEEFYRGGQDIG